MLSLLFLVTCSTAFAFSRIRATNSAFVSAHGQATVQQVKSPPLGPLQATSMHNPVELYLYHHKAVTLEDLPYAHNALEPHIGEKTLRIHHGKHHAKYVTTTNEMIKGTEMENDDVVTLIRKAHGKNQPLFNNVGQVFNHDFYWKSMKPNGGGKPSGRLAAAIDRDFGSYEKFREAFTKAANTAFGSGWGWLVHTPSGLKVTQTIGAGNPWTEPDQTPLLTIDVWEHAYYLDYQNLRANYVDTFLDKLVNWDAVEARLPL